MSDGTRRGPPRWASSLLAHRLPGDIGEAIAGDLQHEYQTEILPRRGRFRADLWFWRQVLTLRASSLRKMSTRLRVVRSEWDAGSLPHHSPSHQPRLGISMDVRDLRYAVRRLIQRPGFTAVAVLSLALGIGANTAMFSIVNAVLIRSLPVEDPESLVEVYSSESNGFLYATTSHADYFDLRARGEVFEDVVGTRTFISRLDVEGRPRVAFGEMVSWDYFQALGVPMARGRAFLPEEDETPGTHPVVILGHRVWVQDFAADEDILGRSVVLNKRPYTVVGVAPEEFTGTMPVLVSGFYVPLMMMDVIQGSEQLSRRSSRNMFVKARLKPETSVEQANEFLQAFSLGLQAQYPESNENRVMTALSATEVSLHPVVDGALTPVAGLLLAVVGLVLLIACANLASFLLAQAEDRRKEIAIRLALGAGRGRLVGQLLVETTLLAAMGGLAGFFVAEWTVGLLMSLQPPLPVPVDIDLTLDRTVLLFTAGISLVAGFAFGLLPALQATNPDVAPTLKNEGTGGGAPRRLNLRSGLVVVQVAFSFVLLIGAGLFLRSLQKAGRIDPGFDTGPAALLWPMPELSGLTDADQAFQFFDRLEETLSRDPAVTGVAFADRLPLGAAVQTQGYVLPGVPADTPDGDHDIDNANVSASYFDVMGVPILAGQGFENADEEGERVVVVSQAFVDRYYPGQDVVGRIFQTDGGTDLRIVGVAADTKIRTLGEAPRPYVYHAQRQRSIPGYQVVVRGTASGQELVEIARQALERVDPNVVLFEDPKSMNDHLALLLFPPRMAALLLSAFGGLSLVLAAIGIYGVVSYAVAKRTRELGIRMALGASASQVVKMAVSGGMRLVFIGGLVGVILAGAVTWLISGFLFGISATDLVTFLTIPLLLTVVAVLAAWVPARRASGVDPVNALRSD